MFSNKVQSLVGLLNAPQGVAITPGDLPLEDRADPAAAELAKRQKDARKYLLASKICAAGGTAIALGMASAIIFIPQYPLTLLYSGFVAAFYATAYKFYEKYQQLLM